MNIKPIGDRILVAPTKEEETTKSGIILPESAKEKKAEGTIIAIGTGEKILKLGLQINKKVLFSQYAGDAIKVDENEYRILGDEDVLAVIE
jgi:chaperonin GroES